MAGIMLPANGQDEFVTGYLDLNEKRVDVLDLEKAIAAGMSSEKELILATEALP